jgi:hypothetical protein
VFSSISLFPAPIVPARALRRVLAVLEDLHAVDEDMCDADGILMRMFVCRAIQDGRGVENNDREHSRFDKTAPVRS